MAARSIILAAYHVIICRNVNRRPMLSKMTRGISSLAHLQLDGSSSFQPLLTRLRRTERRRCSQRCVRFNQLQFLAENLPTRQPQLYESPQFGYVTEHQFTKHYIISTARNCSCASLSIFTTTFIRTKMAQWGNIKEKTKTDNRQ